MDARRNRQNEAACVCEARKGDRQAMQRLLQSNWTWLKGLVYNILGDCDDVDETLQSVCVLVIENIGSLREPERFRPWLATIARHRALAYRRQRSKRPVQLDEFLAAQQADGCPDVAESIVRSEQYRHLLQAIRQLPDKYREVFVLKHVQDITYAQISEILDIPVTTVQIRLVRARRMIHNTLTGKPNNKVPRT